MFSPQPGRWRRERRCGVGAADRRRDALGKVHDERLDGDGVAGEATGRIQTESDVPVEAVGRIARRVGNRVYAVADRASPQRHPDVRRRDVVLMNRVRGGTILSLELRLVPDAGAGREGDDHGIGPQVRGGIEGTAGNR